MTELIPIGKLRPAPDNPRRNIGDVSELAASIRAQGLLQPLLVSPQDDGTYLVVAGHRRLAACLLATLAEVECTVRALDDVARHEAMLTENVQRSALSVLEASGIASGATFGRLKKPCPARSRGPTGWHPGLAWA